MKRPSRSDSFQHLFTETACSNEMMESFCNEDSIYSRLNPFAYNEEIAELDEQLRVEFWRIVETLTPRQREVIKLYADGYTQMEIAKKLKVNQSSITKSLNGNVDYKKNSYKRCYGGSKRKINKIVDNDNKIIEILKRMREIRTEQW